MQTALPARTKDRPLLGITLMLGFCALAPLGDAIAKILGETVPLLQMILVRFGIQAVILIPIVVFSQRNFRMSGRVFRLTALRTVLHMIGIGAMFASLRFLPLADAVAIAFVMPFIMLLLGRYVLGEEVGPRRLAACAIGFIGTLLVIQPSFADVGAPALLPLLVAVVFALFMLVTRQVAKDVDPIVMQSVSGVIAAVLLVFILMAFGTAGTDIDWIAPGTGDTQLLIAIGVLGTVAHLLMSWSLRFAPSATLAPMQYLEIPVATFVGWLIFSDLPDGLAALGIAITIFAGLYIVMRERSLARLAAQTAGPPV